MKTPNRVIQISELNAWTIRSVIEGKEHYFITDVTWSKSPSEATIFRSEEAGMQMLRLHLKYFDMLKGEIMEVVPLSGALIKAYRAKKEENDGPS